MPIRITCPSCSNTLSLKDEFAGRAVKCPKCGGIIPATAPPADEPPPLPSDAVAPPPMPSAPAPERSAFENLDEPAAPARRGKPSSRSRARDDDDDDRPAKRRRRDDDDDRPARGKKQGGSNVLLIVGIIGGVCLLCCGGVSAVGYYMFMKAKQTVEKIGESLQEKNEKVTIENYQKLKPLMTKAEVEAILGSGRVANQFDLNLAFPANQASKDDLEPKRLMGRLLVWRNREDYLFVAFHDKPEMGGKLQMKEFVPKNGTSEHAGTADDAQFAKDFNLTTGKKDNLNAPKPSKPQQADKVGQAITVSVGDLLDEFKDDRNAAEKKYRNKKLIVTDGVVKRWENDFTAQIVTSDDDKPMMLQVTFLDEQQAKIAKIKEGDPIKFRAAFVTAGAAIELNRGWIVP